MTGSSNEIAAMIPPSPWVVRYLAQLPANGQILDLACGGGRHVRWLVTQNRRVLAVDRDRSALAGLQALPGVTVLAADLESGDWPLAGQCFAGIIVTNYLWRPRLPDICALLAPGGVLIYETFMVGNEAYGKPSNPDFLLRSQELREVAKVACLREIAFDEGYAETPKPALRQAICAVRE
jgi:SAM-dependent methyltransferase